MLIRSQDKRDLVNLNSIKSLRIIQVSPYAYWSVKYMTRNSSYDLGDYNTEEEAIRVLDSIQLEYQYAEYYRCVGHRSHSDPNFVFQMPEQSRKGGV